MSAIWICGDCRSANRVSQVRCYHCGVPRATGEMTGAGAWVTTPSTAPARTVLDQANRMGVRYRPTWPLAAILAPTIVVACALLVVGRGQLVEMIGPNGLIIDNAALLRGPLDIMLVGAGATQAGVVLWSFWIALVVANVPALTATWPPNTPLGAWFAVWIPIIGLRRPYSVMRGVLRILAEGRPGPLIIALAWWLVLLVGWFAPSLVLVLGGLRALRTAIDIGTTMLVMAAIFAVALVAIVETEQRRALARRASQVFGPSSAGF